MTDKNVINKDELSDFVIEDEKKEDPFKDLEVTTIGVVDQFDFSGDEEFDIEESYDYVKHTKKPSMTKEAIQQNEADNIIKDTAPAFMEEDFINDLNKDHKSLLSMLRRYDANSDIVKNMSEDDKNKIYRIAEYLFNNFQLKLNQINFSFDFTRKEWKFVYNAFNKLEYDQNEVFQLKEVKEHWLDNVVELEKSIPRNVDIIPSMINVNDLIIVYHLISKYKVKGMRDEYNSYLNVLTKIGERIKLFNGYNVWVQRLSNDFKTWGGSLTVDESDVKSVVQGETMKPEPSHIKEMGRS